MKTTEKNNENNISYLARSIKLGLGVALLVVCSAFISKSGVCLLGVVALYILVRSVFKIIRLSVGIIYSLLSVLFLLAVAAIIISFIL
ncbi:hypothetical protein [Dysgonomonas sp. 216]|uniref:hypothetical protein n=1 Tax=Dysgonomonas sp. 216 TaxID=2302934 RepID=UPI0013D0921F|nr:hypothetical protein [Dysgonomonas sp. 216]